MYKCDFYIIEANDFSKDRINNFINEKRAVENAYIFMHNSKKNSLYCVRVSYNSISGEIETVYANSNNNLSDIIDELKANIDANKKENIINIIAAKTTYSNASSNDNSGMGSFDKFWKFEECFGINLCSDRMYISASRAFDTARMYGSAHGCDLYLMSKDTDAKLIEQILKSSQNVAYVVVDNEIYALVNGTPEKLKSGNWLNDIIANIDVNNNGLVHLTEAQQKAIILNTGHTRADDGFVFAIFTKKGIDIPNYLETENDGDLWAYETVIHEKVDWTDIVGGRGRSGEFKNVFKGPVFLKKNLQTEDVNNFWEILEFFGEKPQIEKKNFNKRILNFLQNYKNNSLTCEKIQMFLGANIETSKVYCMVYDKGGAGDIVDFVNKVVFFANATKRNKVPEE